MTDWDGAGYAHISGLQREMAKTSLEAVDVRGAERVLDVGCGDGYVTRLIAARVPEGSVLGVDPSPRMIATAQAADDRLPNVRFETGDVLTMAYPPEFDLAVSFNALHWVRDQERAYGNIAATLRPDGRVLVQYVCAGERPSVEDLAMSVARDSRWSEAFTGFDPPFVHIEPSTLPAIARAAGLAVTTQSAAECEWDFGSREALWQWCAVGFTDWTSRLPAADAPAFVDEVVARYEGHAGRPGLFRFLQLRAELRRSTVS